MRPSFDVLVVGGGATGTGLARDLAMRGLRCLLVEQGDLANGTTGRFHGLLHSGARYAVRDPHSAAECIIENRVLRRIAAPAVEETGGLFCWLQGDDPDYPSRFLAGCREAGIEVGQLGLAAGRRQEPLLSPNTERLFQVPDATIQPFDLLAANMRSASENGASVRRYTRVAGVEQSAGRVAGVTLEDVRSGETERVEVGVLAGAAGAWAGELAALAGIELAVTPGWGVMVVMNQRLSKAVVNRCRLPSDGDLVVPVGTVSILGTTSRTVDTLGGYEVNREEVLSVVEAAAQMLPRIESARAIRVYAGARPLYDPAQDRNASRSLSRSHTIVDHAASGVEGFVSIVGGKLTTYRLMAEQGADAVCRKLGNVVPCRTAEEVLPFGAAAGHYRLGGRLTENEEEGGGADADLVCECELVTRRMVEDLVTEGGVSDLTEMLRTLRLGMGPCQGAFCGLRAAGVLEALGAAGEDGGVARLVEFLDERLKGQRPVLWGEQARQFQLAEIVYRDLLNLDHAV